MEEVVVWTTDNFSPEVAECFKGMYLRIKGSFILLYAHNKDIWHILNRIYRVTLKVFNPHGAPIHCGVRYYLQTRTLMVKFSRCWQRRGHWTN